MIYSFSTYELDTEKFELRKSGGLVPIEPQVFTLIQFLVENQHRMVSKSEIVEAVWDGRAISDSAISSRIRSARNALNESENASQFIQTIHGKGLRFVAEVQELGDTRSSSGAVDPVPQDVVTTATSAQVKDRPSIAVLPFECLTPNSEDALFASGLTEDVITNLSRFRDLFVFSRVTTTALAGAGLSAQEIHHRLKVDFIIEGSIRKSAEKVRVTFKLIDATSDDTLLSERLEDTCTLQNLFDFQDKISLLIAGRIANRRHLLRLTEQEDARRLCSTAKWGTYRWIAQYYEYMRTRDSVLHASVRAGLTDALTNDPKSSDGAAALAVLLLDEFRFGTNSRPGHPVLDDAYHHAKRAVANDLSNAFAHQSLAMVQYHRGEFDEFLASSQRSLTLNSGRADALAAFGCLNYLAGYFRRAMIQLDQAIDLNPMENGTARLVRAGCHFVENRYSAALLDIRQTDLPDLPWYHAYSIAINYAAGDTETALAQALLMQEQFPDFLTQAAAMRDVLKICDEVHVKFDAVWQEVFVALEMSRK
ncbi:winged helix-turn-helix domain-containing protein [Ruegeria sp. 2205SS24-7]|uniref:winged helix-turn-helix domain-containing tetratricopeptide repeat protein n=1 Tax=Ruegeria discodermiae TaxID=3064389 RepID=UPI0027416598|nr:winged helix-turn-helix domain-containing protein [Ruegeria sp. 2205SS24-7]MDP5218736.1 winged helix-turn-helix domain-containing protein [Ruegeria sp. 2205SS24-7]